MKLQKNRIAIFVIAMISGTAMAAPQGGNFAVGTGTITATGNNTVVDISGDPINLAVINWDSMNVGAGESLTFNNLTSGRLTAVNIDNQGSQTQINGAINSSNTSIVVVNKNGVSLGSGAQINTPSFVAASGNLDMEKVAFGQVYVDLTNAETSVAQDALLNVEYDSSYTSRTYFNVNGVGAAPTLLNNESWVYGGGSVSGTTAYKNSTIIAGENVDFDLSGIVASASVNLFGGHSNSAGDIDFVGDNAHLTVDNADRLYGEISGSGAMHINNTSGAFLFDNVDYKSEKWLYVSSLAPEISLSGAISSDTIQLLQYNNYSNPGDFSIKNSAAITANVWIDNYTGGTFRLENNGQILGDGNRLVMNYLSGQTNEIVNNSEISIGHISTESLKNNGTIYAETIDATTLKNTTSGDINFNASIDATNIENDGRILLNGNGSAVGTVINDGKWSSYGKIDGKISGSGETVAGEAESTGIGIRADAITNTGTIDLGEPPVVEPPVVEPPVVEPPVVEPPVVEPPVVEPPVVEPPVVEPPVVEPPVVEPPVVEPPVVEPPVVEPPVVEPPVVEPPVVEPPVVEPPVVEPPVVEPPVVEPPVVEPPVVEPPVVEPPVVEPPVVEPPVVEPPVVEPPVVEPPVVEPPVVEPPVVEPPVVEPPVVEPPVVEPPVVEPPVVEPPVVEPPVVEPPVVEPPVVEPPVVEPPVVEPPVVEPPVVEPPVVEPPVVEPPVVEPPVVEPPVTTPTRSGISFSNGFSGIDQKNGEIVLGVGGRETPVQIDIEGADIDSKHESDSVEDIF